MLVMISTELEVSSDSNITGVMSFSQKLDNLLLAAMATEDFVQIQADLTYVELPMRQCLAPANVPIEHVYFVQSGIVSVVAQSNEYRSIEVGIVGLEGFSGIPLVLGADQSLNQEFVQVPGTALQMPAHQFRNAAERLPGFRVVLLRYVHAYMTQVAQSLLSVGADFLGPRLARWLLMCQDRIHGPELPLTHEFLAMMLSVRRPGVTESLHILEGRKLIKANRGHVLILDRPGLMRLAGASYGASEQEYNRLFDLDAARDATSAIASTPLRRRLNLVRPGTTS
jgi:CRP-like cAMP-binding protein